MSTHKSKAGPGSTVSSVKWKPLAFVAATLAACLPAVGFAAGPCSDTAEELRAACRLEAHDDYRVGNAICINESESADRKACFAEVAEEREEALGECYEQKLARLEVCELVGEGRYDPEFEPGDFQSQFVEPAVLNPYLPIKVGNRWAYRGGSETVNVEVLARTKLIDEVTCAVVRDTVKVGGVLKEDTDDWFAQANNGDVWYCGEETKDYEIFEGDRPMRPELVSIDGAFKADRDGAEPGIVFLGTPRAGVVYRQEFDLGNAEDVVEVLTTSYSFGSDPELDELVPPALARLFCSGGDCVVTRDFTPLEPDSFERKYYARGVGLFLETNPEDEERVQIVGCNVDPRCAMLPSP